MVHKRGTQVSLVTMFEPSREKLGKEGFVDSLFMDLSNAFDTLYNSLYMCILENTQISLIPCNIQGSDSSFDMAFYLDIYFVKTAMFLIDIYS